jgi:hypothetical protein
VSQTPAGGLADFLAYVHRIQDIWPDQLLRFAQSSTIISIMAFSKDGWIAVGFITTRHSAA